MTLRVALIGLGAIGRGVVRLVRAHDADRIEIVGALVRDPARERDVRVFTDLDALLAERPDVVVEAAGHDALRAHGPRVLRAGHDLLLVSAGALADTALHDELVEAARAGGAVATVVSGAIGALDAISSAAVGELRHVVHTTRKPARTLLGAEGASLREERELFRGPAREAVVRFPESVNVAAAVSLAGIGLDRTEVRVVADPTIDRNRHTIEVEGEFGWLRFEIANVPSDENPRTGRIVAMSVVRALRARSAPFRVGC